MDILKDLLVSAHPSGKEAVKLTFYFDSGSPHTFIHKSAGERLGNLISLPEPEVFSEETEDCREACKNILPKMERFNRCY